jgi:hypothetical protein
VAENALAGAAGVEFVDGEAAVDFDRVDGWRFHVGSLNEKGCKRRFAGCSPSFLLLF